MPGFCSKAQIDLGWFSRPEAHHHFENFDLRVLGVTSWCSGQSLPHPNVGAGQLQSLGRYPRAERKLNNVPRPGQNSGNIIADVAVGDLRKQTCLCPCPCMPALGRGGGTWLIHQKAQPGQETNFRGLGMGKLDIGWWLQASSWPDEEVDQILLPFPTFSSVLPHGSPLTLKANVSNSHGDAWCLKQPRDMCLLVQGCSICAAACFSGKGFLQHERSAGKQRALGREVAGSSWSQWVTCRVTEQLGSSLLCYYFGNINKQKRPGQSLRAPTQALRSPVDIGGTSSLRHQFVHKNSFSFGLWANSSNLDTENIISSPLISRSQLLCRCNLALRNSYSLCYGEYDFNFCWGSFQAAGKMYGCL